MKRRTKIVATLGPATTSPKAIEQLILAGVNVVRLNFSHGSADDHRQRAELVRELARKQGRFVAVLGDLQGPKIRIARFKNSKVTIEKGQCFVLDATLDSDAGDNTQVGIEYKELISDSTPGDILLLDDGRIELEVKEVEADRLICEVLIGGPLSNNKGINRKGGGLSAAALTDKDKNDIVTAAEINVDYLAVSFPRSASDMQLARQLLTQAGGQAGLVAKIERAEAVENSEILDDIIRASDGVMVARGDLGVEIGDAELMGVQKHIIDRARTLNRVIITATQMMESMIQNPLPTRAEVFDVANAVLDGTDAVMLSAETATGDYPIQTVEAMDRVIVGAEKHPKTQTSNHRVSEVFQHIDESIALAAMYAANHLQGVNAIICMTESGDTPLMLSRVSSPLPIFAFSSRPRTQHRVALFRGVKTIPFNTDKIPNHEINRRAVEELLQRGVVGDGDLVIITKGDYVNAHGGTNTLKVVRVGQNIQQTWSSSMIKPLVIGNWRMHGKEENNTYYLQELRAHTEKLIDIQVAVCPPFPYLAQFQEALSASPVAWGSQNVSPFESGAYTGEVSALMLQDLGCNYVLVGHSERRNLFGESDEVVAGKFKAVQNAGLIPVLCIGETLEEHQAGNAQTRVIQQLEGVVKETGIQALGHAVIAYEPVWAIGTGHSATPEQAQLVHSSIRHHLSCEDSHVAATLPLLYGGSVNADNAASLFQQPDINGALVGGTSLDADNFLSIIDTLRSSFQSAV
ncbi:MAG: pyruvate kinase [Gammaproteobacteria bacterium]|nr:pyruvate kinase [Gammaproteobacteria bacterium]